MMGDSKITLQKYAFSMKIGFVDAGVCFFCTFNF